MRVLKYTIFASLILLVAACSNRTPEPLIKEDIQASAQEDYELLKDSTADAPMEIDLYQAISIAIKNNRELRTQVMDSALTLGQIDVVKFDMLPKLSANAGYKVIEKHPASFSETMGDEDGNENVAAIVDESPTYSVSQQSPSRTTDIGFTWNALDFGLSYVGINLTSFLPAEISRFTPIALGGLGALILSGQGKSKKNKNINL